MLYVWTVNRLMTPDNSYVILIISLSDHSLLVPHQLLASWSPTSSYPEYTTKQYHSFTIFILQQTPLGSNLAAVVAASSAASRQSWQKPLPPFCLHCLSDYIASKPRILVSLQHAPLYIDPAMTFCSPMASDSCIRSVHYEPRHTDRSCLFTNTTHLLFYLWSDHSVWTQTLLSWIMDANTPVYSRLYSITGLDNLIV